MISLGHIPPLASCIDIGFRHVLSEQQKERGGKKKIICIFAKRISRQIALTSGRHLPLADCISSESESESESQSQSESELHTLWGSNVNNNELFNFRVLNMIHLYQTQREGEGEGQRENWREICQLCSSCGSASALLLSPSWWSLWSWWAQHSMCMLLSI